MVPEIISHHFFLLLAFVGKSDWTMFPSTDWQTESANTTC